jgi:protein TonB
MAANAEIYFEHDRWGRALAWSAGLHVGVTAALLLYSAVFYGTSGAEWGSGGGGGEAIGATLVSTVPIAANQEQTQNVLANESKGVTKSQPKIDAQDPNAVEIQDKHTKIKPKKAETATKKEAEPPPQEETNQVAFGEGGPVSGPYGNFSAGGAKGGFGVGEGGDFGTRFGWYVRVVSQKVHENWLAYEVDPKIKEANRFYLSFDITRDGRPTNVQVEQSSGVPSLDISAVRAIQRIDTFGSLPPEYSGSKLSVEFWFDYKKNQ